MNAREALLAVALILVSLAGTKVGVDYYVEKRGDAQLWEAIAINHDACKTAPVGEWQKASDFPSNKSAGPTL